MCHRYVCEHRQENFMIVHILKTRLVRKFEWLVMLVSLSGNQFSRFSRKKHMGMAASFIMDSIVCGRAPGSSKWGSIKWPAFLKIRDQVDLIHHERNKWKQPVKWNQTLHTVLMNLLGCELLQTCQPKQTLEWNRSWKAQGRNSLHPCGVTSLARGKKIVEKLVLF